MAITGYCGAECGNCSGCSLDERIPCSPNCENLTEDGRILIKECLKEECEEVKYIFDMVDKTDEAIIAEYGEIAPYPYEL